VGVGSDLRGDDVAGVLVARRLQAWIERTGCRRLAAFPAGAAPENFTGAIARFEPDCVVFLDAAHLGREPGTVEVVPPESIGGLTFSTHMLPAPIFLGYLEKTIGCRSVVLGIEIAHKDVMAKPSPAVVRAVRRVVAAFQEEFAPERAATGRPRPRRPAARGRARRS
jgi:hydrogenase 3 maturation protease